MTSILIGIPTLNGPERLWRALASINECTDWRRHPDVKIVVCDDGSTPANLEGNKVVIHRCESMRYQLGLEMLVHGDRQGIARSWNDLTTFKESEVVVLLNDDIEVVEHWLDALVYTLTHNSMIGMVGLNSYVGITKGTMAQSQADVPMHIKFPRIDYCEARMLHGGDSLVSSQGSAFGFTREAYNAVGGFDPRYFCFYEETDFGVALRRSGRRSYILSYPILFHMGGATTSDGANLNASEHMARSRELFVSKWGKDLKQLREEFTTDLQAPPRLNEWNTQINNWG